MALFKRVTIVGLGLIGGSLGMAITRRRLAREIVGLSRTSATLRKAKQRGAIDAGTTDAARAVRDADLVILATPVDTIVPQGRRLARLMRPGSILTDVGSTKRQIVRALTGALPHGVAFVGAHPLAGSEQRGIEAARLDLFDGSVCIVARTLKTDPQALARVMRLWKALTSQVLVMEPAAHDRLVAAISHLPHLIAFCLMEATRPSALAIAPRSFLEATRVAKSDPELWDGILLGNRTAVLAAVGRFDQHWRRVRHLLEEHDVRALQRFLRHAQALRQTLPE